VHVTYGMHGHRGQKVKSHQGHAVTKCAASVGCMSIGLLRFSGLCRASRRCGAVAAAAAEASDAAAGSAAAAAVSTWSVGRADLDASHARVSDSLRRRHTGRPTDRPTDRPASLMLLLADCRHSPQTTRDSADSTGGVRGGWFGNLGSLP